MSATGTTESAVEALQVIVYSLISLVRGFSGDADLNRDGNITVEELFECTANNVTKTVLRLRTAKGQSM
jgi:hypothetical protein